MANTVEELDFRLVIKDEEFNQKIKEVKAAAEQLNRDLSDILDIKNKVTKIGKDEVASAKQHNQILKDNAKTQEAIARETEKTAQANRKLRATTDSNIAKTEAVDREKVAQATIKTATAQERLNQLVKRGEQPLRRQSQLWQQLKNLSTAYFSVMGASRLVSALVRTTAEFELQRTTLGAILQDVEKANVLYEQMKELAVKSPFNFKELATYAKQLSAYSIPVNELYDTTKMLADVSAGLGVGMDRLVLAYGQIRSASFLRGQEVRQLTEAGIPILEELRKQFVELGEEGITVGDVFDKISRRMVPFEMVSKVFKDMTSEGGKFYQMQEVQAETLRGKLSNLKDAFQIMLSEIGDKQGGILKGSVDMLRSLADNYEKVGRAIVALVATYGAYKASLVMVRLWQSAEVLAMTKGIGAYKKFGKAVAIATTESKAFAAIEKALTKINPWAALAAAVVGIGAHFISAAIQAQKFRKELEQMAQTKFTEAEKSVETFKRLADQLKNSTEGSQSYRDAISQLNRQYGDYLPNLLNEKNALQEILKVENEVTNAIYARAKAYASEEGMRKVEDKYGEDVRTAGDTFVDVLKNYWANPANYGLGLIGEESASTFIKGFRVVLENESGDATELFKREMTNFFGWAPENFDSSIIKKYAKEVRGLYNETEKFQKSIDRQFGSQGYSTFLEGAMLRPIENAFDKAKRELDSTTMSVDEYNEALNNLKLDKLNQIKSAYEYLDAESGKPGSYTTKIKEIQEQIDALQPAKLNGWRESIAAIMREASSQKISLGLAFSPKNIDTNSLDDVIKEVQNRIKEVTQSRENAVGIEDDAVIESYDTQLKYLEEINKVLLGRASIEDKNNGGSAYDARIRRWKREAETVKELKDVYDRWKDLKIMSDEEIIGNLREIYKNTTMVEGAEKKLSETLFERIKREEGYREKAYKDTGGVWTIGYGFTKGVKEGDTITREEADKRLKEEIEAHSKYLKSLIASGVKMSQNQYEALLDLAYNAGEGAVKSLYEKFDGNMEKIGEHLLNYRIKDRAGNVLKGLLARREREYEMFFTDSVLDENEGDDEGKLILDFDKKIREITTRLRSLGDKGAEAAEQVEHMFGRFTRKDEVKELENFAKRVNEYVEEAKSNADKIKDLEAAMASDLEMEKDESRKAAIIAHYTAEIEKLKEELTDITSIQLTDFWQQLTGEKNGTYGNLTRLQRKAEDLRDALKNIAPNRNKEGKITGYTLTQKNNGDILKTLGVDAESLQLSVSQVEALNKAIEKLISQRAEKNGIFALVDALGQEGGFKTFWEDIKNGSGSAVDILRGVGSQLSELGNIFTDLGEALDSDFLTSLGDTFSFLGGFADKLANGDLLGAVGEIVKALTGWITAEAKLNKAIAETAIEAEKLNASLRLSEGVDTIFGENTLAKMRNAIDLMKQYRGEADAYRNQSNRSITWKSGLFNWGRSSKSLSAMVSELGYDLYDAYGNLNAEALQAILDTYENLTSADRKWIEDAIKNSEIYADAMEQMNDVLESVYGQTLDSITDALIDSWKQAGDAALDYADILDDVANSYARMLIKNAIAEKVFNDEFKKKLDKATEDKDAVAAIELFESALKEVEGYTDYVNDILNRLEPYFNKESNDAGNLADGIKGITEDTANLLASYLNAIRADVSYSKVQRDNILAEIKNLAISFNVPTLNDYLNQIQANTFDTAQSNREILSRIDSVLGIGNEGSALRVITT